MIHLENIPFTMGGRLPVLMVQSTAAKHILRKDKSAWSFNSGVLNPWAAGRYQSMGHLVLGHWDLSAPLSHIKLGRGEKKKWLGTAALTDSSRS